MAEEASLAEEEKDEEVDLFGDYDSEAEQAPSESASRKRKRLRPVAEEAPGDEQREAASGSSGPRPEKKRKRKVDIEKFFDREAEEAGGSEDEDEDAEMSDLIDDTGAKPGEKGRSALRKAMQESSKELEELTKSANQRGPLSGSARLFSSAKLDDMEARYQAMEERQQRREDGEQVEDELLVEPGEKVSQTVTVPDPNDPKLWCVKTFGPEKELCMSLLFKAVGVLQNGGDCPIYSVFCSPHLRGYIYIEAFREADVKELIKGIRGVSIFSGFTLVPTQQMPMVFTASQMDSKKASYIQVSDWVRIKRGPYAGDLALVEEIQDELYTLKLKPRLHTSNDLKTAIKDREQNSQRRPQPRWFNRADLESGGEVVNTEQRRTKQGFKFFFVVDGETYRDGFLFKQFKGHWFHRGDDVRPQEYELQDWRNTPAINENTRPDRDLPRSKDEQDREMMPPPALPAKVTTSERHPLEQGDHVIVISGDLKNLRGEITQSLFGSPTVLMRPMGVDGVHGDVNIAVTRLSKYFEVGSYVKILGGENTGDTGYVTQVELPADKSWSLNTTAKVLSSSCEQEFRVKVDDLQKTIEKAAAIEEAGEFKLEQMVHIAGRGESRAVIVRLETESRALLLLQDGHKQSADIRELQPVPALPRKIKEDIWCMDRKGNKIVVGCVVKAPQRTTGRGAPIRAEVLYIHDSTVFIRANEALVGDKAYLACPGEKCEFVWNRADVPSKGKGRGRKQPPKVPDKTEAELEDKQISYGNIVKASQVSFLRPEWFKRMGIPRPLQRDAETEEMKRGSSVRITGGGYKGLRGEVRDMLDDKVRISLLAKTKLVEVSVNNVQFDDYCTPKETRFGNSVPKTPTGMLLPLGRPEGQLSAEHQLVADMDKTGAEVSEDDLWDPDYLMTVKEVVSEGGSPKVAAASPEVPQPPSRASSRRSKRQPRIPGSGEATPQSPASAPGTPLNASPQVAFSPASKPLGEAYSPWSAPPVTAVGKVASKASWLIVGAGVSFKSGTEWLDGWIIEVVGDMATVLPAHKQVDKPTVLESSETRPWECKSRGDMVLVHSGPKRNTKGKIVGVNKNTLYIRRERDAGQSGEITAAGSDMVQADRKDVVMYSSDPKESVNRHLEKAAAAAEEATTSAARADQAAGNWWDQGDDNWEDNSAVEAKMGDEDTPRTAEQADTPVTAGEATPMVEVADTPPEQQAATPFVQGGQPLGAVTPMPGGLTPMLPGGTPMVGGRRGMGGVTPFMPRADIRVETPLDMKKAETPLTPRPGAETPRPMDVKEASSDTPMVPGAVTPGGGIPLKKGEDTPMTPTRSSGVMTPGDFVKKAGDDTPASGSQTPFTAFPGTGDVTPLAPVPGGATPAIPPPGVGDDRTPLAKDEGSQTPMASFASGDITPQAAPPAAADRRRQAKKKAALQHEALIEVSLEHGTGLAAARFLKAK
eukprot:CAMPEP_0197631774 /NCGR_PEP_ID=MMETSP1338-20131121/8832_1 /TAXON_ID=43686 ORGANISM="Pelagodinium beii, Strain RCC1491" /NCGR_SAMPLE_ID=MMETSP1338 /ASSEMBLY_ACC=CAM_ASM_000754 /LENGTH=1441 /DNA_ID=CAMNT_0043203305 /DNA_START=30 /DNA_END=4356 /DNA_ORIENTATION=+